MGSEVLTLPSDWTSRPELCTTGIDVVVGVAVAVLFVSFRR